MTLDNRLTRFQYDLLAVCAAFDAAGEQPIGKSIGVMVSEEYGEVVDHARVYQNLAQLVDEGLVETEQRDGVAKYYTITDEGLELVHDRVDTLYNRASDASTPTLTEEVVQ